MFIYSVHDTAAEYYLPPFIARKNAEASRMFVTSLGESFQHRADYNLYSVAAFDPETGLVTAHEPKIVLAGRSIANEMAPNSPQPELDRIYDRVNKNTHKENGELIK